MVSCDDDNNRVDGREGLIFKAKLAEQAERYDDMVEIMKQVAMSDQVLNVEERNLLSVAYKNVIGTRRASWRILSSIKQSKDNCPEFQKFAPILKEYREVVEKELTSTCNDILDVLSDSLVPKSVDKESDVFYYKMKGDYFRYLAEFYVDDQKKEASQKAFDAYTTATETAQKNLQPTHPIRLGLALNFSVFYYEIALKREVACSLARRAFDEAIAELDTLNEDSYKDSTLIMQLLRDNLALWTSGEATDDKLSAENKESETAEAVEAAAE